MLSEAFDYRSPNTPAIVASAALLTPFIGFPGRFRWSTLVCGGAIMYMAAASTCLYGRGFQDPQSGAKLGIVLGATVAGLPLSRILLVETMFPLWLTTSYGVGLMAYHTAQLNAVNNPEIENAE